MAKKNKEIKLTDQQILFCHEYMKDLNATQAAIRAGYSPDTAQEQSSRMLSNVMVRNVVNELRDSQLGKIDISAERILQELAKIAFADMRGVASWNESGVRFKPSDELTDVQAAMVSEVSESLSEYGSSVKIKQFDKVKALEMLGKFHSLWKDKVEHSLDIKLEDLIAGSMKKDQK